MEASLASLSCRTVMAQLPAANQETDIHLFLLKLLLPVPPCALSYVQHSLGWFIGLFVRSISDSARSDMLSRRLETVSSHFTYAHLALAV